MAVKKISAGHGPKVVEVLEELLGMARSGELVSLGFVAELVHRKDPLTGVVGRYREDPSRLLGEMVVMKAQLAEYAASRRQRDFGVSGSGK